MIEKIGLKFLQKLDPETAHNIALIYLKLKLFSRNKTPFYPKLETDLAGIKLKNPIGLAAGFDKNAVAIRSLAFLGFGFTEVGAVTPVPQSGNPKPRVFRINDQNAIINHYGFNNHGMTKINKRLKKFAKKSIIGINIGANNKSLNMAEDFAKVLELCTENVHFATINISSPNTKNLRSFQKEENLRELLTSVRKSNNNRTSKIPIFIKISPEIEYKELEKIVMLADQFQLAGIVATNTSIDYQILHNEPRIFRGGVSGKPLFKKSTKVLARLSIISEGKIPLIGVGGVSSGADAYEKICAGASAVQLYSALTFFGPNLIKKILHDLNEHLDYHGYSHISEAVGSAKYKYK